MAKVDIKISSQGLKRLEAYEGFSAAPYKDIAGFWTIGYGHNLGKKEPPKSTLVTRAQAEKDLLALVAPIEEFINKDGISDQKIFDSLCSLIYNVGRGEYYTSHLRKFLIQKISIFRLKPYWLSFCHYTDQFGDLRLSMGLYSRRQNEYNYACGETDILITDREHNKRKPS